LLPLIEYFVGHGCPPYRVTRIHDRINGGEKADQVEEQQLSSFQEMLDKLIQLVKVAPL
jgi:hypothetical protein